jgi:hypothetical protein
MPLIRPVVRSFKSAGAPLNFGHPINRDLVAFWGCSNGGGLRVRDLTGHFHGTRSGIPLPAWTAGKFGHGLSFDGTASEVVDCGSSLSQTGPMTILLWIRPSNAGGQNEIVGNYLDGSHGNWGFELGTRSASKLSFIHGATVVVTSSASLSNNAWYQVAAVRSGTTGAWTATIYINGVIDSSATTSGNPHGGAYPTWIGDAGFILYPFSGVIDHAAIWSRALSAQEIQQLYVRPLLGISPLARRFPPLLLLLNKSYASSGGITSGGAAAISKTKAMTQTGGLATGGTGALQKQKAFVSSGGSSLGGTAPLGKQKAYTASGGANTGGTAASFLVRIWSWLAGGGVSTGGVAGVTKAKSYQGSGGATTGGTGIFARVRIYTYSALGGLSASGTAALAKIKAATGSSGAVTGGSALRARVRVYLAAGGALLGGAAITLRGRLHVPRVIVETVSRLRSVAAPDVDRTVETPKRDTKV